MSNIPFNLNLPETPKGVPDELFNEFRRIYNAIKNIGDYSASIADTITALTPHQGFATLVAGTRTVLIADVKLTSKIFCTVQSLGTVATMQAVGVTVKIAGTSFTIKSADATDTSIVAWFFYP